MGIRHLNKLMHENCPGSIKRMHFQELRGKKIAVDVSIYMYRFLADGALLENMYLMASILRHYDIHGIFVFDGPPPVQKTELIELRKKKKEAAKRQYNQMERILQTKRRDSALSSSPASTHEILEIEETMTQLKKQFIHIRDSDIANVKDLLASFGFAIVDAEGEADALCAKLAIKRRVFACMSDDMDMFVYGCPFVLRHVSLLNHSAMCYNMKDILRNMELTQDEFKMMCVVSGTDYTLESVATHSGGDETSRKTMNPIINIFNVYDKMKEYKRLTTKELTKYEFGFYEWLEKRNNYDVSLISLIESEQMFDISNVGSSDKYKQLVVLNRKDINKRRIVELMMKEDFIFINSNSEDKQIFNALSNGSGTITSSPVYGVGQWESKPKNSQIRTASPPDEMPAPVSFDSSFSSSASSSGTSMSDFLSRRETFSIDDVSVISDATEAVKCIDAEDSDTNQKISQDDKAAILAREVYGVNATTVKELTQKIKKSRPITIKK